MVQSYLRKNDIKQEIKGNTYLFKNQKEELSALLKDGQIPLSNSLTESSKRPFALHHKNWLFADSQDESKANAVFYSIIENSK